MTDLQKKLSMISDVKYADFQAKLVPGLQRECFLGVRVPDLRKFACEFSKTIECKKFLESLPHKYYDENMLHSILIGKIKDYDEALEYVENFLPFVNNWAVCDTLIPKAFAKNKDKLLKKVKEWIRSTKVYTCRFGIDMLMSFYLDDDFKPEYLRLPSQVRSNEYYVNMMIAWYYATALAKQWDSTIPYIENKKLPIWVHNKSIQKAIESYRITDEQKAYLRTLKNK